ncbi:hypothetical protein chiPu_0027908, partial [Chiloscyllium punctatum]|nr:hypothetical protein [Chiloscyllium punctatum]
EPAHRVVEARRAVGGDVADQRDDLVIGPLDRRDALDRRAYRPAGAERDDDRRFRAQRHLQQIGAALGNSGIRQRRRWISRHDVAMHQIEPRLQTGGELHAGRNGVFETKRDQPLRQAERHKALRRSPRHLQHFCNFILGVPGDEVQPAGARRIVEAGLFVVGRNHRAVSAFHPEISHRGEDSIRSRLSQQSTAVRQAVVGAADKSPHFHARGLRGRHPADAVLDHQRAARVGCHRACRMQEQIRRRLALLDHLRGVEPLPEARRKAGQLQREFDPLEIARRSNAIWQPQLRKHRRDAGNRLEPGAEGLAHIQRQFRQERRGQWLSHAPAIVDQGRGAAPEEEF